MGRLIVVTGIEGLGVYHLQTISILSSHISEPNFYDMVIFTNSDIIIRELNILMMLHGAKEDYIKEYGYTPKQTIDYKNVVHVDLFGVESSPLVEIYQKGQGNWSDYFINWDKFVNENPVHESQFKEVTNLGITVGYLDEIIQRQNNTSMQIYSDLFDK